MTKLELVDALGPFLQTFGADLSDAVWHEYHLALEAVNPGDLDDAMADLRRTHAFRNAPLPAEILSRCDVHRKSRTVAKPEPPRVTARPDEGEWKTHTFTKGPLKGSTIRLHVLPDDHPALPRYACGRCQDTSWEEVPNMTDRPKQATYRRCACWQTNPAIARQRSKDAEFRRGRQAS